MKLAHDQADADEVCLIDFTPTTEVPRLDQLNPPCKRTRRRVPIQGGEPHD